jgi:hypothetical protein
MKTYARLLGAATVFLSTAALALPIIAVDLFADTFDGDTQGAAKTTLAKWTLNSGANMDVITCPEGNCVDLDGTSSGAPATLTAKTPISLIAGRIYFLGFTIPTGDEADPFSITIGPHFSQTFSGYSFPLVQMLPFTAAASGSAGIVVSNLADPNDLGPHLDRLSVFRLTIAVPGEPGPDVRAAPEPASLALLAMMLAALAFVRQRVRGNSHARAGAVGRNRRGHR